jgi:Kef-type K+ transport system membrane component KefB/CBS domain-containing protein
MNILLVIGIVILLGAISGGLFQKLKLPAVMGYIIIGIFLGKSFHGVLSGPILNSFGPLINLALGIIGFMIGSELNFERFKRYSRSIYTILFCETIFTFCGVALLVTLITGKLYMGLILGALSSATAPAATYSVLGEYKARGPVTMTTLSIVALDDVFALVIFGLASAFAMAFMVHGDFSIIGTLTRPVLTIGLSVVIGLVAAYILHRAVERAKNAERLLPYTLGTIILVVGLSIYLEIDPILAAMALGAMVSNLQSSDNREMFESMKKFSRPIYILFFVLVGARLDAKIMVMGSVPILAISYIFARSVGKMAGAYVGGKLSKAKETVTKYLGFCLFDQAGVAVGLSIAAYNSFSRAGFEDEGLLIINIVTATTFVLQFLAPPMIKYGIKKADEMYRNITEEDVVEAYKVGNIMDKDFTPIKENNNLHQILDIMKNSDGYNFPVVGMDGKFIGVTSLGEIRETFYEEQMDQLIVAGDIVREMGDIVFEEQDLKTAIAMFQAKNMDYIPVLDSEESHRLVGQLEYRKLMDHIAKEVLLRQQEIEA